MAGSLAEPESIDQVIERLTEILDDALRRGGRTGYFTRTSGGRPFSRSFRKELREGERRGPAKGGEVYPMANWIPEALSEFWIDPGDLPLRCD